MYLAPQNIPRATSVLTLGSKVLLYCEVFKLAVPVPNKPSRFCKQNVLVHPPRPLCPSAPAAAGRVGAAARAPCVGEINSGESLHCFLVGVNECYVMATADL